MSVTANGPTQGEESVADTDTSSLGTSASRSPTDTSSVQFTNSAASTGGTNSALVTSGTDDGQTAAAPSTILTSTDQSDPLTHTTGQPLGTNVENVSTAKSTTSAETARSTFESTNAYDISATGSSFAEAQYSATTQVSSTMADISEDSASSSVKPVEMSTVGSANASTAFDSTTGSILNANNTLENTENTDPAEMTASSADMFGSTTPTHGNTAGLVVSTDSISFESTSPGFTEPITTDKTVNENSTELTHDMENSTAESTTTTTNDISTSERVETISTTEERSSNTAGNNTNESDLYASATYSISERTTVTSIGTEEMMTVSTPSVEVPVSTVLIETSGTEDVQNISVSSTIQSVSPTSNADKTEAEVSTISSAEETDSTVLADYSASASTTTAGGTTKYSSVTTEPPAFATTVSSSAAPLEDTSAVSTQVTISEHSETRITTRVLYSNSTTTEHRVTFESTAGSTRGDYLDETTALSVDYETATGSQLANATNSASSTGQLFKIKICFHLT